MSHVTVEDLPVFPRKGEPGPRVVIVPPAVWAMLNARLKKTAYGRLVALGDGSHKLELTEAGSAADDEESRQLRLTILYLQGAGIRVQDYLSESSRPLARPTNAERMHELRTNLLKKGRW